MGTQSLWEKMGPEDVIEIINEHELKDYGTCSDVIYQKAKDLAMTDGVPLDDITFIISHLN